MKKWTCDACFNPITVVDEYVPEMCCNGFECGCYGKPINPAFCEKCEDEIFRKK